MLNYTVCYKVVKLYGRQATILGKKSTATVWKAAKFACIRKHQGGGYVPQCPMSGDATEARSTQVINAAYSLSAFSAGGSYWNWNSQWEIPLVGASLNNRVIVMISRDVALSGNTATRSSSLRGLCIIPTINYCYTLLNSCLHLTPSTLILPPEAFYPWSLILPLNPHFSPSTLILPPRASFYPLKPHFIPSTLIVPLSPHFPSVNPHFTPKPSLYPSTVILPPQQSFYPLKPHFTPEPSLIFKKIFRLS